MKTKVWLIPILSLVSCLLMAKVVEVSANAYIQQILILCLINIILALSLNLVNGFTGQFSLGHAGFMAVGAYFSAWLSQKISFFSGDLQFLNFPLYAILGGGLSAFAGFVVGMPSLRLKGDYLAIVTLGFGEIIRVILLNMDAVGGARGFYGIAGIQDTTWASGFFLNFSMTSFWTCFTFILLWRLIKSTHGRTFLSVREDEVAAESIGINTTRVKVKSFVLSSFFAGVAGSLFAHYSNFLNPSIFQFVKSVDVVIMVVLGGMGSFTGSILGAIFVTLLPEFLRPVQEWTGYDLRMVIYSLALILLMITKPSGIMGTREFFSRKT